jgi:hypothetical protein
MIIPHFAGDTEVEGENREDNTSIVQIMGRREESIRALIVLNEFRNTT